MILLASWKRVSATKKVLPRTKKAPLVRKVGYRNLTDKEAKREGRTGRKKNYVNTTDGAKRASHKRKKVNNSVWPVFF